MSQKKFNRVFYTPASAKNAHPRAIDYVMEREDGTLIGAYSHKTLQEMANDGGTEVLVMDTVTMDWPVTAAAQCAQALRELLQ